jgi:hypothetical protein
VILLRSPGLGSRPADLDPHDYKRHGTTTLFAALSVLDGTVIGRCMQLHRHLEFIRFLNAVERQVAAGKPIHVVLDNYATHEPLVPQRWTLVTGAARTLSTGDLLSNTGDRLSRERVDRLGYAPTRPTRSTAARSDAANISRRYGFSGADIRAGFRHDKDQVVMARTRWTRAPISPRRSLPPT